MQEFGFIDDPAETAAMSIAADKMPLTPHLIALQLSDFLFGKPSLRDANEEARAQQFIQNFLENIPPSLLDLHDEDALHAELTLLTEDYFPQKTSEQIQDHIAEMLNEIEEINTRFPKDRWDKLRDHLRPTWEKQFLGHASHPSIVNQKIFVEDALEEIKYRLPHTRDIDSLFWREGGAAEQMLGNLYTISTTTGEHLAEGLKRLETFTETPLPKELKRSIT